MVTCPVTIVSYDLMAKLAYDFRACNFQVVIADESHYLKNELSRVFAPRLHHFPLPLQTHLLSWILLDCYPGKFLGRVSRNFATRSPFAAFFNTPHPEVPPSKDGSSAGHRPRAGEGESDPRA